MPKKLLFGVFLLLLLVGCTSRSSELMFYVKSRDIENDNRVKIYLNDKLIIDMDLASNDIEENYNKFHFNVQSDQSNLLKVLVNDSLVKEKQFNAKGFHEVFIVINSPEKKRDYNNIEIYKHLEGKETNNLIMFADSLYDNHLIKEKYIQLPKDSIIDIDLRKK